MTTKRVSRQVKKETSARDSQYLDQQAQEDALDRAEQLLSSKKLHQQRSPGKQRRPKQHSDNDEESGEDDEYDSEMEDFIANDEEVEAEFIEAAERQQTERKKKRRHVEHVRQLDDDDVDLIRENVGIEVKKKSRLKRTAMLEQVNDDNQLKQEDVDMPMESRETKPVSSQKLKTEAQKTEPAADTRVKKQRLEYEQMEVQPAQSKAINPDRLLQAQKIFGESNEQPAVQMRSQEKTSLKEFFNADEIDDPFNTEADLRIAEADIPERLQVKLENRLRPDQSTQDLQQEAEWVLERLTCIPDADNKYGKLVHAAGTRDKVLKVLKMFHCDLLDIPMICKYRKFEYAPELDEDAVWHIFNLDQEFGKFQRNKAQVNDFLLKVLKFDQRIKSYIDELTYAKSQSELNNFNALIRYLRYQFTDQLTNAPGSLDDEGQLKRKQPQSRDEIQICRSNRIHEFQKICFLECGQFQENLQYKKLKHSPPEPKASPQTVAAEFCSKAFNEESEILQAVCRYAAVELAAQPQIRNMMKKQLRDHGQITVTTTEQGKKDLDIFHQSYRVKLVENLPLKQLTNSDLYLDIQQCEKANLIHAVIELPQSKHHDFKSFLEEFYMDNTQRKESWNLFRTLVIKILVDEILHKELIKEVRDEIQQEAEAYVICSCKKVYTELLMTGPFQTALQQDMGSMDQQPEPSKITKRQEDIIKPRERLVVMGALMHQIDANNYIVTIAVVDKYGEIIAHKDFMRLLPPRIKKQRQQPGAPMQDPLQGEPPKTEEQLEHERDRATLIDILEKYSVDFIVVAANSLEARTLKRVMDELGFDLKNKKPANADEQSKRGSQVVTQPKEAFVIWGSTEAAKLFALSHNSQKLHKGVQQILKQTISLARFEQDPLTEILNLWSPIVAENQALALQLDPFQKLVNQSKLADGLEEVNIRVVNKVGVDLNVVIDHEHMHCCLQFLSGLGPRMAKRLLAKFKGLDKKLHTRGELLKQQLIPFKIYFSVVPFVLIKILEEDFGKNQIQKCDILDQTRIHHEHYKLAMKIATDACTRSDGYDDSGVQKDVDKTEQNRRCKEVIARPQNLKNLDLKAYYAQLDLTNQGNMRIAIDHIIEEFRAPFADPRQARTLTNLAITDERLFYLLIDESKKTFKRGLIVTATVSNVLESKVICRLENGLNATIIKEKILDQDSHEKLRDVLDIGFIITGRIEKILTDEGDKKFEVQLNCKKGDLHSHDKYLKDLADSLGIDARHVREEDKKNLNFAEDQKPKMQGRFTPRRIAHEKFKNISSRRALAELQEAQVGEFVFRPSTRSEDAITLTWKFSRKQFVHIDIAELEKMPGAAIGQRLMISNEHFDNLREIVERYIIPCNRLVREVTQSPKWSDAEKWEDLEEQLKDEKNSDKGRIPYRFAILPQYQQHLVLAYVPREKVIKEFIKVRPRGFYFHEQNLAPFINLVNWFKDQWQTKDYQRYLKRQRSPRTSVKTMPVVKETPGEEMGANQGGHQWQAQGGNSVYSNHGVQAYSNVKSEQSQQRSFGRGQRSSQRRGDSPSGGQGGWGDNRMKYEQGGRSPAAWQQDNRYDQQDVFMAESYGQPDRNIPIQRGGGQDRPRSNVCYRCNQEGHFAKDCQNPDQRGNGPRKGCFNCGQDGHIARECQEPQKERRDRPGAGQHEQDRGGFKRQRIDGGSLRRNADGGFELGWNDDNQNAQAYTPRQDHW